MLLTICLVQDFGPAQQLPCQSVVLCPQGCQIGLRFSDQLLPLWNQLLPC